MVATALVATWVMSTVVPPFTVMLPVAPATLDVRLTTIEPVGATVLPTVTLPVVAPVAVILTLLPPLTVMLPVA